MRIDLEIPEEATPGRYGVYVLLDADGEFLYIGHTKNLFSRMRTHRNTQPWWREVRKLEWNPCDGYQEARHSEKSLIALYTPRYNEVDWVELSELHSRSRTPELPDWAVARLVEMREEEADAIHGNWSARDRLDSYILSLRNAGWSLGAIGRGLSMTRERVRQRQARATRPLKGAAVPGVPPKPVPVKKVKPTIPAPQLAELKRLHVLARQVRGWTPIDDPTRAASERFTELIAEQYLRGVSIYRIAQQLGVTHLAVRARLARHGYVEPVKGLPGNVPYGTPWRGNEKKTECKAGHSLTDEANVQVIHSRDGSVKRACKACDRRRAAEYYARKKARAA